ncbi:N-alpha-acetyltransferase 35, NatC auxiliary subunit-like [Pomacea canaliculata]|uniref:N-alpha-acetyltransferase 35, NatC auxiliary subunit-like n=1 Tax=Pomacea canaliculata TaxID=400727 RepID=UPI000D7379D0|nr:N-alpha-acetyltransferase 35, NatC auxiliary subunit-like [Pomacea canaliculata]
MSEGGEQPEKRERPMYSWVDVTAEFKNAASQLSLGELLHDSSFGLFEAMSAIEMMDPKMDAGMLCNQISRKVYNLEQAVEEGLVKIDNLTPQELIGTMDASLATLVTWLEGHSLAQTVFTNLYLHNPYIIEDRCLKAFSIVILKTVDIIRERINRAGCFEEEDFQPMSYGFKMAGDVTEVRAAGMLKEIEDELGRTIRTTRQKAKGSETSGDESETTHVLAQAVHSRVRFYRHFYALLLLFSKDKTEGLPQAQKLIIQLQELVPLMHSSLHLGIQAPNREASKNDYPTIMGFEPLINQRLLPPTFPRYTVIRSRAESLDYITSLLQRLHTVTMVTELTSLHAALEMFMEFSKSLPCVLARSILQLTLLPPNRRIFGMNPVVDSLKETIRSFIAPPVLSPKCSLYNNSQAKDYVDALLTRAARPMCTLFQITGHNRARQRDKWAHVLEDLSNLQEEADKVDAYLHSLLIKTEPNRSHLACLGTWVLYHTLQTMINYTLAGFELELYAPYEYHYVYWYLSELLFAWLVSTLHRADNFLLEHETLSDQQKGRSNKKNKKKKRPRSLSREITVAQAQQQMFGAYFKAVMGLQLDGKMKHRQFEFDSEEVRYSHRFAPFVSVVTPSMIHYSQYKDMSDLSHNGIEPAPEDLYGASCKGFHQAKCLLESLQMQTEEVQSLLRVAKTNFVVMKLLVSGHKKESVDPPEFDFGQHKVYPVIKVV